jgi:hypothetical protein
MDALTFKDSISEVDTKFIMGLLKLYAPEELTFGCI